MAPKKGKKKGGGGGGAKAAAKPDDDLDALLAGIEGEGAPEIAEAAAGAAA
eukprot:CAMPEP_0119294024 /NCGR_PEP_ID=MMETSP1329-20130426/47141_1 /TAXON_ID=114041 /ORGANISM="Genus nov. species nov., Strain RCC1024" /LENGTH=50 /DNA_ID=CAMNT_0007294903 /DNA_START=95 /DNA_END=243 /DNA_ORIENTATION=+